MARILLVTAMHKLSALASTSIPVPGLSTVVPRLSAAMLRLSAAISESSVIMPKLFTAMFGLSIAVPGLSTPMSAFVPMPQLSTLVHLSRSAPMLLGSSLLAFLVLSLPKILTLNLAARRQKLDNTISGRGKKSEKISLEELWSGRLKKAASKETFLPKAPLFPSLFPSSSIGERKFHKTFINTQLLANNHTKKEVNLSFVGCGCPPTVK